MIRILPLALALLLAGCGAAPDSDAPPSGDAAAAPSLEPGLDFDRAQVRQTAGAWCHLHGRYAVVVTQREGETGTDVLVRRRGSPPSDADCAPQPAPGDFARPNEYAEYFVGLKGDHLFLDSGTGPDHRDLLVYHVPTRRRVLVIRSYNLDVWRDAATLGIWLQRGESTRERCPGIPEGLDAGTDSLVLLDTRTMRVKAAGEARCAARQ